MQDEVHHLGGGQTKPFRVMTSDYREKDRKEGTPVLGDLEPCRRLLESHRVAIPDLSFLQDHVDVLLSTSDPSVFFLEGGGKRRGRRGAMDGGGVWVLSIRTGRLAHPSIMIILYAEGICGGIGVA